MEFLLLVPPSVYVGVLAATSAAFMFHAFVGHMHRSGLLYWPFGLAGFAGGGLLAQQIGMSGVLLGDVSLIAGLAGALAGLVLAHLLLA